MQVGVKQSRLQVVFVVLALVAASCQCAMACTLQPCQENQTASQPANERLPPCHQHHQSKHSKSSHECLHASFVLLDHRLPAPTTPELLQAAILPSPSAPSMAFIASQRELQPETASPPSRQLVSSTVLKV